MLFYAGQKERFREEGETTWMEANDREPTESGMPMVAGTKKEIETLELSYHESDKLSP